MIRTQEMLALGDDISVSGRDSTGGMGTLKGAASSAWRNPRRLPGRGGI